MTLETFIRHYPVLYHMADARNWPSIQRWGLLSTQALLERMEVESHQAVEERRAGGPVQIDHPRHGAVFIRDQHQIREKQLAGCLIDVTPERWRAILNARVFFWPTLERLESMYRYYQDEPQLIFEIPSAPFINAYQRKIELSRINSGFIMRKPARRGLETFQPFEAFQHSAKQKVAELTIPGSAPDILDFTRKVMIRQDGRRNRVAHKRP
jgi:hypothetical protein